MAGIMTKEDYIDDLQSLLQFINSNPMAMLPHELAGLAYLYSSFMAENKIGSNFLDISEFHLKCTEGLTPKPAPKMLKKKQQLFSEIIEHARNLLDDIIHGVLNEEEFSVLNHVTVGIKLKIIHGKIQSWYFLSSKGPKQGLSVRHEKDKIDVLLLNIINALGSDLMRIKKCNKEGCNIFFWQPTKRPKNYCSQKCAGAVRQQKYMAGKPGQ
jgi:hypothetical protein